MYELIFALLVVAGFGTSYLMALYASAIYVDPDELQELAQETGQGSSGFLTRLAADPRSLLRVAVIYKAFALVACSGLAIILLDRLSEALLVTRRISYPLGLVIMWVLFVLIAEVLPPRVARHTSRERLLRRLGLVRLIYFFFSPFLFLYTRSSRYTDRSEPLTEEDKEEIVERAIDTLAEHAGISEDIVDAEERLMINRIFLLDQTVAREIMLPRINIVAIEKSMSFEEIRKLVARDGHSRYPVYEESIDRIIGLLYVKDMFIHSPAPGAPFKIESLLRKPYLIHETKVIGELLREFKEKHQHIALVMDEYGGLAGLVTLEDIVEEIFGEIQDEHDQESGEFELMSDGSFRVSAGMLVERLQEYLDTDYEEGDYDTVGGLIYHLVGSVPRSGQRVQWHDLEFEVERLDGTRIVQVRVQRRD